MPSNISVKLPHKAATLLKWYAQEMNITQTLMGGKYSQHKMVDVIIHDYFIPDEILQYMEEEGYTYNEEQGVIPIK